jgi:DNA-binding transcriptional ArsR family regulator
VAALAGVTVLLRALGAPVRLAVVAELWHGPRCVADLVTAVGVSQSLVSQHLRVLREAGVVARARHGRRMIYRLADDRMSGLVGSLLAEGARVRTRAGTVAGEVARGVRRPVRGSRRPPDAPVRPAVWQGDMRGWSNPIGPLPAGRPVPGSAGSDGDRREVRPDRTRHDGPQHPPG